MSMYLKNQVGNVFKIEAKEGGNGKKFAIVSIAINSNVRDGEGNFTDQQEDPFFINALCFGKTAEELLAIKDGKFFGRLTMKAATVKDDDGKSSERWTLLSVEAIAKKATVEKE